jgi:hypothetical protein
MTMVNGVYKYEHRIVMEKKLGRKLRAGEQVNHKNGIPSDNRPGNLEVVTMAEHNRVDPKHRLGGRTVGS